MAAFAATGHAVRPHGDECHRRHDGEGAWPGERSRRLIERAVGCHSRRRALPAVRARPRCQRPPCGAGRGCGNCRENCRCARASVQGSAQLCRAARQERPGLCFRTARSPARHRTGAQSVDHALSRGSARAFGAHHREPRAPYCCRRQRPRRVTLGIPASVIYATAAIYALLVVAMLIVALLRWRNPGERYSEVASRTDSWWWMIGAFTLCILLNQTVAVIFLAFISYLALKEYLSLIPTRRIDRDVLLFAYLAIPLQYYWAAIDWYGMFIVFVPVWMFLFLPPLMVLRGQTEGFLRAVGTLSWGLMMTVFTLSHMAWLLVSGDAVNPVAGGIGLLFFLVVLTQFNDVAQYCWGKLLGRHKVTPHVSPKKTWEGLIGGLATTTLVAALAGPYLTPMDMRWSALAGLILGIAGFLGDITMSAMKRDLGVKDTGGLIPGHGGILDRVDSLTYAAPVFVHFVRYFYYP